MSACTECLRRAWLLGALNGRLEYRGRAPERLIALLELSDEELIRAVGGDEAERLQREHTELDPAVVRLAEGIERVCRHDRLYPSALQAGAGMPSVLHLAGGLDRLRALEGPTVAIVGTRTASDYGMEVAHGLARGLATSGVTVLSGLADGIAAAAHAGALQAGGPTITVMGGGVDVCRPVRRRALHQRVCDEGCALAELPCGQPPRGWCHTARARIVVALARVVVVVEARERVGELVYARLARDTGRALAAVPGRLGSAMASGPHALLREGAQLVRDAGDILEMLYEEGGPPRGTARLSTGSPAPTMEPGLRALLDQIGAGRDTVTKLLAGGAPERETLVALARLELEGALARGDGGRYVARV